MYNEEYKRWMAADFEDADLKPELSKIEGNDEEIKERFAVSLKFGTAGLRGVLGAGTNRMNIYVVRQATQGLANWVKTQGGTQTVAISYDSRLKSDVFAKTAAGVLAANGIKVRIYDALMPVPALSFATRYYECNAGIMVTASHNPAKYNGYKAYGPDGCQMTDDAAAIVYDEIQKTDVLTGAKYMSFAEGVEEGLIRFVGDDCKRALYDAIESRQVRPGLCKTAGLKLVYSPLNGSGLVPVTQILKDIGITDVTIVPEQEYPNGYFQTSAIDCAGKNDVVLKFQHLFRWNNWFTGKRAGLWVGVSNDGVNWKEYNVMDKIPAATQLHAPVNEEINISEVAANQKTVYLRFFWRDIFSWYWMVDDIELTEPFAHDLALEKVTSHQETGNTFTKEDVLKVKLKNVGSQPVEPFALPRRRERIARPRRRGTHRVVVRVQKQRRTRRIESLRTHPDVVRKPFGRRSALGEECVEQVCRARLVARHRRSGHQPFEQCDRLGLQFVQSLHNRLRNRFVNPGSSCRPRRAAPRPA